MKKIIVPLVFALALTACKTTDFQTYATPTNVRIAVALICSNTLNFAVKDTDRVQVANYIYSVAHGIRTLSTGAVPSPAVLAETVALFTTNGAKWTSLGTSISSVYGGIYANVKGNPKLCLEYLEAIAAGCEDAATAYLPAKPAPTS